MDYLKRPPAKVPKVKPPDIESLLAEARAACFKGDYSAARKRLAAAREQLKLTPDAEHLRQVVLGEAAIALSAPGNADLDRIVDEARQTGASDLLADALGRRAVLRETRELIVADLDAAIATGKNAKTAYGLASLAEACVLRANYDNHPAYAREARNQDLDAAAARLKEAEAMASHGASFSLGHRGVGLRRLSQSSHRRAGPRRPGMARGKRPCGQYQPGDPRIRHGG